MTAVVQVSARDLKAMIHDGGELALLDVREAGEFGEAHLLFATPLPYSRLELDIRALVPRRNTRVVLCDDGESGVAALAARRLASLGYSDLAVLDGGTRGWADAGYALFAGVNVPSKLFGELVEHDYSTPHISVQELARMKEANADLVIVDGRPYNEYHKMNIPDGICCPNAELPYRIRDIVRNPETTIVVNCAGRTRSILGAQTLINFGITNPVYALENGTQGWVLADFELERGADRRYPDRVDESRLPEARAQAQALASRHGVRTVSAAVVQRWLNEADRTTFLLDVRTHEEFSAGSTAGAAHAPGGQLIQATDQWVGVRNARIVLIDSEGVRAPVVASWLAQLGCDVSLLEDGTRARVEVIQPASPRLPELATISADELDRMITARFCAVLDLRPSMTFREGHIPGSRWSVRPRIGHAVGNATTIVLVSEDADIARLAAIDLAETGAEDVRILDGGYTAWTRAGRASEATPDNPPNEACIDYLFFVHDRHAGNRDAMRQYLAWETGLIAQLDDVDRQAFRVATRLE
jgi:rhodanese-related sulfurtransferase